ncbi:MAG: methyltransferase [Candidatus Aramenus sulfurataquae]|uniref:Methyltransferase n=1 Tax=Candidatus Aramenus sulfurataquae TaxID=1326980 RepID=W7KW40_9CREN|nr:MAG: methyltransferase [Candidatus Aramenus sulfurataquae]
MVLCAKIPRRQFNELKKSLVIDPDFELSYDGDYIMVPVKEIRADQIHLVECKPSPKKRTPKLNQLIPGVSSYYVIGDIALVSMKESYGDTSKKVGEVIMSINRKVRSVFLRKKVTGQFRVNELELLAGENKTDTVYKENGLKFYVDVAKVYVNPTMARERLELRREVKMGDKVLDAFTGYGPIALNLAVTGAYVVAGDLNLEGLYMLKRSMELNKIRSVDVINYDASFLPFRDKSFDVVIGDNPTMARNFLNELCRVTKGKLTYYVLERTADLTSCVKVNDYAKDLFIFKCNVACDNVNSPLRSTP